MAFTLLTKRRSPLLLDAVCAAPKRRFRPYDPPVAKNANATDARKARKEQLKKDESVGKALPIGIAVGIVALAALFFYLNSVY